MLAENQCPLHLALLHGIAALVELLNNAGGNLFLREPAGRGPGQLGARGRRH